MTHNALDRTNRPVVPTPEDIQLAKQSSAKIAAMNISKQQELTKSEYVLTDKQGMELQLSKSMFEALTDVIKEMAAGKAVMLIPVDAELTTQEAADMLNVSRPYFVGLLDQNKIPYRTVGRYRRVRYNELACIGQQFDKEFCFDLASRQNMAGKHSACRPLLVS